jgi:hypothetical protein
MALSQAIFSDLDANTHDIGATLDKAEFFVGSKAYDKSDRIIYNANNGKLFFDHDGAAIPRCSSASSTIICTSRCTTSSWSPDGAGPQTGASSRSVPAT